jgi:HEAT repeat protein
VRSLGVLALPDTAGRVAAALGDPAAEVRWTAATVLGRLGQRTAVDPLRRRLRDPHAEVRRQAALALGYLGDRRALEALRALGREDDNGGVREAAAYAAGLLGR